MASYYIKFLCSLFITGAFFCFADGGVIGPWEFEAGKGAESSIVAARDHGVPAFTSLDTKSLLPPEMTQPSLLPNNNQPSLPTTKTFGENLATKYFGKDFIKGFRWGYKADKRIQSVAKKCEKVMGALVSASCPKPTSPSPSPNSPKPPLPNSEIVNCIVEVTNFVGLHEICTKTYESSEVPIEANCILDEPSTLIDPDHNCVN